MLLNQNFEDQDQNQRLPEAVIYNKSYYLNSIIYLTLSGDKKSIGLFHCSTFRDGGSSILPSGSSKTCVGLKFNLYLIEIRFY
jgi:hypothetical protein